MTQIIHNNKFENLVDRQQLAHHEQTIVALCSPQGSGAIGLIRISGLDCLSVADKFCSLPANKKISIQETHTIHYGHVVDGDGKHIDQVLFLLMKAPKTFTGQDIVEITCHNNQFLVEKIIDRAIECGARLAGNGEFTQRAVMFGKIDLLQAEAINDLIHAQNSQSLKYSLSQLQGSFSSWIAQAELSVIEMVAFCEASFEFIDEEIEFAHDISIKMNSLIVKIESLLKTFSKQQYIKEGIRIVLIGSVNAGKSSLFNCLLEKKRAIVTPIPGTTRDTIEAGLFRNGDFLTVVDTAGIRKTDDQIEQEGIDRSFQEAEGSDIILLVIDGSQELSELEKKSYQDIVEKHGSKIILVKNKTDLSLSSQSFYFEAPTVSVSAKEGKSVDQLFGLIEKKISDLKGSDEITCLLNKRQHDLLTRFLVSLKEVALMLDRKSVEYEIVSCKLKEALVLLSEMTGRNVSEAILNQVFQSFCVGK
ncbi:MAG: tRNA uridine-5-carboxymethylaminomethyl(34) synthesis GTPase MnmE [Candidatus Dependentiae bacterium]|nr:tRNA uridine-5-carboxymethylaminomethyl(34) synthesis GTPase MnmE [Candidatus Dependentiae bacterium]